MNPVDRTNVLRWGLLVGGVFVTALLLLLARASDNSAFFDRHYPALLGLNVLAALTLLCLVCVLLGRLYRRLRRHEFGSRLMAKLVLLFAFIGILPGILVYVVSVQFVSRSIESWFDVRVESALEAGLNIGRTALESSLSDLTRQAQTLALELSELSDSGKVRLLARLSDQQMEVMVSTLDGRIIASVGERFGNLLPSLPNAVMLRQARSTYGYAVIENDPKVIATPEEKNTALRLRTIVEIPPSRQALSLTDANDTFFLQIIQRVSPYLAHNAEAVRQAYGEYQERSIGRSGLRKIYLLTLTLTLLLAIFGAIASAFVIATDFAKPLLLLAEGTKAVAEGNLSPRPIVSRSDELGLLTQSFDSMTRQLADARAAVEKNRADLQSAKAYLESVLANMSAGVMVLDEHFHLVTCNESVERILHYDCRLLQGRPLSTVAGLKDFAQVIIHAFSAQATAHWQHQMEVPRQLDSDHHKHDHITLLVRGSRLPMKGRTDVVIVFDDISDVISGQRSLAWGEVARRLAHEIKNPLTPIQLATERLKMKLEDKLSPADATLLRKSTTTIINQVAAMKRMVDDFRDYSRIPPSTMTDIDLNHLISDITHLYLVGDDPENDPVLHVSLDPHLPKIMGDETQLRQVIHNLLQNAQDAVMEMTDHRSEDARIDIITQTVPYKTPEGTLLTAVRLSIMDNGPGFSSKMLSCAFEPYVTSKTKGSGLGLPMVKKILDQHGARIHIHNRTDTLEGKGAKILILLLELAPNEDD